LVVSYDTGFVLLRPRSIPPSGDLSALWSFYDVYLEVDPHYKDLNDGLGIMQAYMNIGEILVSLYGFLLYMQGKQGAAIWALVAAVMTFWKTTLYFGSDAVLGFPHAKHLDPWKFWGVYFLPGMPWLFVPLLIIVRAAREIGSAMSGKDKRH